MGGKIFAERFNRELSSLGFPEDLPEKIKAITKVFGVSRHLANAMIFGQLVPSEETLEKISSILEVCPEWLNGEMDRKKPYRVKEDTSN